MANVYPFSLSSNIDSSSSSLFSSSSSNNNYISSKRETLTVWMKSLVVQGNGCTAYNDKGEIVYRVDNYDKKNNDEVYLMDLQGKVLFTILRKKMWGFCRWEGYRSNSLDSNVDDKPLFRVNKSCNFLGKESCYRLESSAGKSALRILDNHGRLVAEAKVKESSSGVVLGDDILNLVMEIGVDQSLVMALVTVYGLMRHKM
ncbi:hypothetical protein UlMin_001905 [Ulmus minor]